MKFYFNLTILGLQEFFVDRPIVVELTNTNRDFNYDRD